MRKLASIQQVIGVNPIFLNDGTPADSIEEVRVLGWRLIAKKGEFALGDLCVYFELDSLFNPELEWVKTHLPFMETHKWRLRTLAYKKFYVGEMRQSVVSQGLALPVTVFSIAPEWLVVGQDLTEMLSITKWERVDGFKSGDIAGEFPVWLPKTDEERIQSNPSLLDVLKDLPYVITMKMDGTSVSTWTDDEGILHVASRNWEIKESESSLYWNVINKYREAFLKRPDLAFQGEIYGVGVQANPMKESKVRLAIFSVFSQLSHDYIAHAEALAVCQALDIPFVPIVAEASAFNLTLDQLEAMADTLNYPNTDLPAEGLVIRNSLGMGRQISFKCISKRYLLKRGE